MKKLLSVLLVAAFICSVVFAGGAGESSTAPQVYSLGTASLGGNFFTMGAAMAAAVMDKTGLNITAQASGGSAYNAGAVNDGELSFGMAQASTVAEAWEGTGSFKDSPAKNIRTLVNYSATPLHVLVRRSKNITDIKQLAGLRIECLVAGDGVEAFTKKVLPAIGISLDKVSLEYSGNRTQAASRLKTGQVDAILDSTGLGSAWMADVYGTGDFNIVELTQDEIDFLCNTFTEQSPMVIPAGTYAGQSKDIKTVGNWTTIFCSKDVPDDVSYSFVKSMYESKDSLVKAHSFFKDLNPNNIIDSVIATLHPGAEKYYREIGVIK